VGVLNVARGETLICHHIEPYWENSLNGYCSVSTDVYLKRLIRHLRSANYSSVILTRFEEDRWSRYITDSLYEHELWEELLAEFIQLRTKVHIYGYGWDMEMFDGLNSIDQLPFTLNDVDIIIGGNQHSQVVLVPEWIQRLKGTPVKICGMFDGECVLDLETALDSQNISYKRLEHLIV
jgi:hypothetical protein